MNRLLPWLLLSCLPLVAEDKIEEHFFAKDGKPCSITKWLAEIKTGTVTKVEKASFAGIEYSIETHYSGIDTRDPDQTPDFKPLVFETVVIGPTKVAKYDGFIAKYEYNIDAKAKVDDVKTKITAGAAVADLAKDEGQIEP